MSLTGVDEPATVSWIEVFAHEPDNEWSTNFKRIEAHWFSASEELQNEIWTWLRFMESTGERCPLPRVIANDYQFVSQSLSKLLEEWPHG